MKKNGFIKRILVFVLCLAMAANGPMTVLAGEAVNNSVSSGDANAPVVEVDENVQAVVVNEPVSSGDVIEVDAEVQAVIDMIEALPEGEEIFATAEAYAAEEDWDGYEAYATEIAKIAWPAYRAYEVLSEEQKAAVTNYNKLMDSSWIWSAVTLEEKSETVTLDGALCIKKQVDAPEESINKNQEYKFKLTLSDNTLTGTYCDLYIENGEAEFILKHGEAKRVTGLPVGLTYTITETDSAGYIVTVNGQVGNSISGIIQSADELDVVPTIEFVNVLPEVYTDKTISGSNQEDMVLTLEAFVTGNLSAVVNTKPADIVVVFDHSGSMLRALDARSKLAFSQLDSTKGQIEGYYVSSSDKETVFLLYEGDKWYYVGGNRTLGKNASPLDWNVDFKESNFSSGNLKAVTDEDKAVFEKNGIYQTRYGAAYDALVEFASMLKETGMNHRLAITTFAHGDQAGTGVFIDGTFYQYKGFSNKGISYANALEDISTSEGAEYIDQSIKQIYSGWGYTYTNVGLEMANNIFAALDEDDDGQERDRMVVMLSDGLPSNQNKGEDGSKNLALAQAKTAKSEHKATVYAIGVLGADDTDAAEFMQRVSSNYDYTEVAEPTVNTGSKVSDQYYQNVVSDAAMKLAFGNVILQVGGTQIQLDHTAILRDTLSKEFDLDTTRKIQVYTAECTGYVDGEYTFGEKTPWEEGKKLQSDDDDKAVLGVQVNAATIDVTGFDYEKYYVAVGDNGTGGKQARGRKLIVELPIKAAADNQGGNKQATNDDDKTGIYDDNLRVEEFPDPFADVPTTVTVKKVVDGTFSSDYFKFNANYDEVTGYTSIETGIAGESNYLEASITHQDKLEELRDSTLYPQDVWNIENVHYNSEITITEEVPAGHKLEVEVTYLNDDGERVPLTNYTKLANGIKVKALKGMEITFINTVGDIYTDKYVSADDVDKLWVTLEAFTTGEAVTVSSIVPTDVVFLLDQSSSMHKPEMAKMDLHSVNDWGVDGGKETGVYTKDEFKAIAETELGRKNAAQYCYWIARDDLAWYKIQYKAGKWELTPCARTNAPISDCFNDQKLTCNTIDDIPERIDQFYVTQYGRMYESVRDFIEEIKDTGGDHRVAVVGFAGYEGGNTEGCSYLVGDNAIYPASLTKQEDYANILLDINDPDDYASLQKAIDKVDAGFSGTCTAKGFDMVADLLENVPAEENRNRVVILVSDGNPYRKLDNEGLHDLSSTAEEQAADNAVWYSQKIKKLENTSLYAIGTTTEVKKLFLDYASSKYPNAQNMTDVGTSIEGTYSFYCQDLTQNNSILNAVIKTIITTVMRPVVQLDATNVLRDTISEHFQLDITEDRKVEVYTALCTGMDSATGKYTFADKVLWQEGTKLQESDAESAKLKVAVNEEAKSVEVTGFDYSKYFVVVDKSGTVGRKIIVRIPVKADDDNMGGTKQPTNDDDNTGIYDEDDKIGEFPDPFADVPTTVTVKKIVDGTNGDESFEFTVNYDEFGGYKEVELTGEDESNYLQAAPEDKNVEFALKHNETKLITEVMLGSILTLKEQPANGYKIQSVTAEDADGKTVEVTYNSTDDTYSVNVVPGLEITVINEKADLILDKVVKEDGDNFKLELNAFVTGSNGVLTQRTIPSDIVLVIDESASMNDCVECGHEMAYSSDGNSRDCANILQGGVTREKSNMCLQPIYEKDLKQENSYVVWYEDDTSRVVRWCETCKAWISFMPNETVNTDHFNEDGSTNQTGNHNPTWEAWNPFAEAGDTENFTGDGTGYFVQFYKTCDHDTERVHALKKAVQRFLAKVYSNSLGADGLLNTGDEIDNRVAIVGFDERGDFGRIYTSPNYDSQPTKLDELAKDAEGALLRVLDDGDLESGKIIKALNKLQTRGETATHKGMEAAEQIFEVNSLKPGEKRNRVVILFTDGSPGYGYLNMPEWANEAIKISERLKDEEKHNASVYCVGLFPGADCDNPSDLPPYNEADNGATNPGFYANGNRVLHLVSSNYPNATSLDNTGSVANLKAGQNYYMSTEVQDGLDEIFKQLSTVVTGGGTTSALNGSTILRDVVSDNFVIRDESLVTAWTESFAGYDSFGNRVWKKDAEEEYKNNLVISFKDNDGDGVNETVEVTGFEYSQHYVHETKDLDGNIIYEGKRIVVNVPIKPSDENKGGTKQETNDDDSEIEHNGETVKPFPDPYVDIMTSVKVVKNVVGTQVNKAFDFNVTYETFQKNFNPEVTEEYQEITLDAPGSNYLQAITGVTTEAVKIQDDGYQPNGAHIVEEVKVGSTFTISEEVLPEYTVKIEVKVNGETITEGYSWDYAKREVSFTVQPGMEVIFTNVDLYELPSTGGTGIYLYMLSGMFMMMAGALMIYKNKRKEVQRS